MIDIDKVQGTFQQHAPGIEMCTKLSTNYETMKALPKNYWGKTDAANKVSDQHDHESCCESGLQIIVGTDNNGNGHHKAQQLKSCDTLLMGSLSLPGKERARVSPDINTTVTLSAKAEVCCSSVSCESATALLDSTSRSDRLQMSVQYPSAGSTDNAESDLTPHLIKYPDRLSIGNQTSTVTPNVPSGACVSGHDNSTFTGARPKLSASRKLKRTSKSGCRNESVRMSEERKSSFIDDVTYHHYRNYLLHLIIPRTPSMCAAIQAVSFMYENVSPALIDIAVRYLWVKNSCCPSAASLYTTISNFKYDEKSFVLAFIDILNTEKGKSTIRNLFDDANRLSNVDGSIKCVPQHSFQTESVSSQVSNNISLLGQNYNSLSDDINAVNSEHENSPTHTVEPLADLDFQIATPVSQLQNSHLDFQLSYELEQTAPVINQTASLKDITTPELDHRHLLTHEELQHMQVQVLQQEHEYLKSALTCVLCRVKPVEVTLLPCGHFVLCSACSDTCSVCPVCNKVALAEVKTFLC